MDVMFLQQRQHKMQFECTTSATFWHCGYNTSRTRDLIVLQVCSPTEKWFRTNLLLSLSKVSKCHCVIWQELFVSVGEPLRNTNDKLRTPRQHQRNLGDKTNVSLAKNPLNGGHCPSVQKQQLGHLATARWALAYARCNGPGAGCHGDTRDRRWTLAHQGQQSLTRPPGALLWSQWTQSLPQTGHAGLGSTPQPDPSDRTVCRDPGPPKAFPWYPGSQLVSEPAGNEKLVVGDIVDLGAVVHFRDEHLDQLELFPPAVQPDDPIAVRIHRKHLPYLPMTHSPRTVNFMGEPHTRLTSLQLHKFDVPTSVTTHRQQFLPTHLHT